MYPDTQSLTPSAPLFHTQRIRVHAVATSVSVTDQMKLPAIDPRVASNENDTEK